MGWVYALLAAAIAAVLAPTSAEDTVFVSVVVALAPLTAWRAFRLVVEVGPAGVVVRNFFASHSLPWAEVAEITSDVVRMPAGSAAEVIAFRMKGTDRTVRAMGTVTTRRNARRLADVVNRYAAERGIPSSLVRPGTIFGP
jgi:hypothetical protein